MGQPQLNPHLPSKYVPSKDLLSFFENPDYDRWKKEQYKAQNAHEFKVPKAKHRNGLSELDSDILGYKK